jgi:hypothetical protein
VAINLWLLPLAICCAALLVTAAGWFAASRLLQSAPLETLRAGLSSRAAACHRLTRTLIRAYASAGFAAAEQ